MKTTIRTTVSEFKSAAWMAADLAVIREQLRQEIADGMPAKQLEALICGYQEIVSMLEKVRGEVQP